MSLIPRQVLFTRSIALLIDYATDLGYGLTFGDAYRDARVHGSWGNSVSYSAAYSVHKVRLAVDFNLTKDGVLVTGKEAIKIHNKLHDYWDAIGGAERIKKDLNHYSFEYHGYR